MRQLSADSIAPSSHANDVSSPSGSHASPAAHKSSSDSAAKRASQHSTHNSQSQSQQKQLGNLVADINALALDNSSSQSKASQSQQQQQIRSNQSNQSNAGNNQQSAPMTPTTASTNGNGNCIQTSTNSPSSNMVWQQTSPNATNGSVKLISTDNTAGKRFQQFFLETLTFSIDCRFFIRFAR